MQVIGRIMTAVERVRVDSETDFANILDLVHQISIDHIDDRHFFTLSQVYEDLLLKMGEKNSDGGQFFTPREVVRAMVHTLAPQPGETIYDPCCGSGGMLIAAKEYIDEHGEDGRKANLFGQEFNGTVWSIAKMNMLLHGISTANLQNEDTLVS